LDCSRKPAIDLHVHSTASDGTLTPAEIIDLALAAGLGAIAITDHDSIAGSREALLGGIPPQLGFLTGVEVSAEPPPSYGGPGSIHILGYGLRLDDPDLNLTLERLQNARRDRTPKIVRRLNALGIPLTLEEVLGIAADGQPGRPHIAKLLVAKGVVPDIDAAFDRYLGNGRPAYVDKYRIDAGEAIARINAAGGIPVLAHPGLLKIDNDTALEELLGELMAMGLKGIEVYYPDHGPVQTRRYAELARRHGLLATGGSDFHGDIDPRVKLGVGKGDLCVPYTLYQRLIES
jgi:hypothetical protein